MLDLIKVFVIGVLGVVLLLDIFFIICCLKISSEVKNDNKPSQSRKTKINQ